jgi:hypothetical protein
VGEGVEVACAAGFAGDACPGGEAGLLQPGSTTASKTQQNTIRFLWKIMRGLSWTRKTVSRIASSQITLIRKAKPVKRGGMEESEEKKFESSACNKKEWLDPRSSVFIRGKILVFARSK